MNKFKYKTFKYRFASILQRVFSCVDMSCLHEEIKLFDVDTDQSSKYHKKFYDLPEDHLFFLNFKQFVVDEIKPLFDEPIIYQKKPTFRIHLRNNVAVGAFHRDRDYNHFTDEVNFFVPLTKAFGSNTVWVESEEGKEDFSPMEADYGEFYMWDGANLAHGNKKNETGSTRVSFDFRVLPKSKYTTTDKKSVTQGMSFKIGEYYEEL